MHHVLNYYRFVLPILNFFSTSLPVFLKKLHLRTLFYYPIEFCDTQSYPYQPLFKKNDSNDYKLIIVCKWRIPLLCWDVLLGLHPIFTFQSCLHSSSESIFLIFDIILKKSKYFNDYTIKLMDFFFRIDCFISCKELHTLHRWIKGRNRHTINMFLRESVSKTNFRRAETNLICNSMIRNVFYRWLNFIIWSLCKHVWSFRYAVSSKMR